MVIANYDYFEREKHYLFQVYKRLPIVVERADGCYIYDINGNKYLDFLSGIAVNALGHSHPEIIEAAEAQIRKYMHISNYFYQEPQIKLAEKLSQISGYDRVFFSNSGTEATEGALKLIRRWGNLNNKREIIAFKGGFHGRTYGALSLMDKPKYKEGMEPFLQGIKIIDFNDASELEKNINENTAAIVLEFIQGEGGIVEVNKDFIKAIINLKESYGFLILADEIQSGLGRTGKFFAYEHYDIKPDIVIIAKALGGGLPLGAILSNNELANYWGIGTHGTTYGGNAVACACGLVVIDALTNGLLQKVEQNGEYLKSQLLKIMDTYPKLVKEVRGKGLMLGLLLTFNGSILVEKLLEKKVISNFCSEYVLRIIPPLIVDKNEIDIFVNSLDECLSQI